MKRVIVALLAVAVAGLAGAWVLSAPVTLSVEDLPEHEPNLQNGQYMFAAGGCSSCHATPKAKDKTRLAGGLGLKTPFGVFYAPNISPDKANGIGGWTQLQFVNAMMRGVSPRGAHYYPAFPYTSYAAMRISDVLDLKAYIDTLPAVQSNVPAHDLALPFRIRRALGLWKFLYFDPQPFKPDPKLDPQVNRGAYLVNGPGHCGECHTPRNILGGKIASRFMGGGPAPAGDGDIPNITPHASGIGEWTPGDIEFFLETGQLPDGDFVGGEMVPVQENMAKLSAEDRKAIARYLKSIPQVPGS